MRTANIQAARAVADAIRTSLGPRGMDKMIQTGRGETIITNDGNTMLRHMSVLHPAAKMLVDLANAQDIEAGDGTTSVVVVAGSLLGAANKLLDKGIHPTVISEAFQRAAGAAVEILHEMSVPISITDRPTLLKAASTSLSSKIVSQEPKLALMAVDSVLKIIDPKTAENVDLNNIRILKKPGGTLEESEMVDGLVMSQQVIKSGGGPTRIEKARIGLIQFCLSPPKPDMENQIVVNDYRQMDKILKEERTYLLNMVKKIKKAKCNVLFIQKSILRDAVNDLSLHFLAKLGILAIKDIERDEVEFICKVCSAHFFMVRNLTATAEHWLQTDCRHRLLHGRQARYSRPHRRITIQWRTHCPRDWCQICTTDCLHRVPWCQPSHSRRSGTISSRRPVCHPLSGEEEGSPSRWRSR